MEHVDFPEINIWGSFVDRNFEIMKVTSLKREKKGQKPENLPLMDCGRAEKQSEECKWSQEAVAQGAGGPGPPRGGSP